MPQILDLDLSGKYTAINDFHGQKVEAVTSFINAELSKGEQKFHIPKMEVKIPLKGEEQTKEIILGRFGFFTEFDITFRENAKRIELTKIRH